MPKKVEYIGNVSRWPERAITGEWSTWFPGQMEECNNDRADKLLATGLFKVPDETLTPEDVAALKPLVSGNGFGAKLWRGGSRLLAGKSWLRMPTSVAGMQATSASATIQAVVRRGRPCIEVSIGENTTPQGILIPLPSAQTVSPNQHMVIEVENAAEWNGGSWRLGFFDGALGTLTNGMQAVQTVGAGNAWNGMHCIAPLNVAHTTAGGSTTEWTAIGTGAFNATLMTQIAVRAVRKAAPVGTARFWLYEIAEDEKNTLPQIVVGADDGHMTWYTTGLPLVERYGFSSYLSYIADDQNGTTRMRDSVEWVSAIARGHHAVVHGCKSGVDSLRDYFADYLGRGYASPAEAMAADVKHNRDAMVDAGLDPDGLGRTVYVLPQGYHQPSGGAGDDTIAEVLDAAGMVGARRATLENAIISNGGGAANVMYLPVIGHWWANASEATNISNVVLQMQTEIAAGRSVVLMFHEVRDTPSVVEHITPANLNTILAAASALVRSGAARAGRLTDLVYELRTYNAPVHIGA